VRFNVDVRAFRSFLTAALAIAALSLSAGCGGGDDGGTQTGVAPSGGAKIFSDAGCANCHTLKAAGAEGTSGPNLDELRPNADRVERQVRNGGAGMPAFEGKLSDEEIREVSEFVAASAGSGEAKKFTFEPDDKKLEDCNGSTECVQQAFGNLAYDEGPAVALERLNELQRTDPAIQGNCHPIAHMIGAGGLRHFEGSVGKAFVAGDGTCGSGYYHGLLQWKLAGVEEDEAVPVAREACTAPEIRDNSFNYYQCNHGLGHGLMLYTGYELPIALRMCHGLKTEFDQVSCSGGVFMENLSSSFGLKTRWVRDDNLLYPCNIVSHQDKLYCYLLVTSRILPEVGWNWEQAADWCRRSEKEFVSICFQSYGRDASGTAVQDPKKASDFCARAGSGEKECIFGASRDIMNNNSSDPRGEQLCKIVKAKFRSYCFYGLGTILGTQHSTPVAKREACAAHARGRDLSDCLEGAGA
jgi:mono/diheme cytochrome c family protein